MGNATEFEHWERSAKTLATLIQESREILEGLLALRSTGERNDHVVNAIMGTREVNRIRLGWELVEVLMEGEGFDSENFFIETIDLDDYVLARTAIWPD